MTKEEVYALPRFPAVRTKNPPRISAVYFLFRQNEVSYVGSSINLHSRIGEHISYKGFDEYAYVEVPADKRKEVEKDFIILLLPEGNRLIGKNDTYTTLTDYLIKLSAGYREAFEEIANEYKACTVGRYTYYHPEKLNPIFEDFKRASDNTRQLYRALIRLRDLEIQNLVDKYLD